MDAAAERPAGEAGAEVEAESARGVEWVVARVEAVRRPNGRRGVLGVGDDGDRHVAVRVGREVALFVGADVLQSIHERDAVEAVQAIAVGHRAALSPLLVADDGREVRVAVEDGDAEAVRCVHEPGIGV